MKTKLWVYCCVLPENLQHSIFQILPSCVLIGAWDLPHRGSIIIVLYPGKTAVKSFKCLNAINAYVSSECRKKPNLVLLFPQFLLSLVKTCLMQAQRPNGFLGNSTELFCHYFFPEIIFNFNFRSGTKHAQLCLTFWRSAEIICKWIFFFFLIVKSPFSFVLTADWEKINAFLPVI